MRAGLFLEDVFDVVAGFDEVAGAEGDFFAFFVVEGGFSDIEVFGFEAYGAFGGEFTSCDGSCEVDVEGGGDDEMVFHDGVDGEVGRVIQQLKINGAVEGSHGVEVFFFDFEGEGCGAFCDFDVYFIVEVVVDRGGFEDGFEVAVVLGVHGLCGMSGVLCLSLCFLDQQLWRLPVCACVACLLFLVCCCSEVGS